MANEKPGRDRDESVVRMEIERKRQWEADRAEKMLAAEKESLRQLHLMKCPKCGMDLCEIRFEGIAVDRCVSCGGTWFDEGEIDLILRDTDAGGVFKKVMAVFRKS